MKFLETSNFLIKIRYYNNSRICIIPEEWQLYLVTSNLNEDFLLNPLSVINTKIL
jgi:hypothetical protein